MSRRPRPDFLIIGAPKAGTSALHAALREHPQVYVPAGSQPARKEPKFYLCDDAPPPSYRGPGDRHSLQEWVWRREDYEGLFVPADPRAVRGESTPFYLWSRGAHRRIAEDLPDVKLIVVIRDPIDRAYSNWMHLWVDGLEPEADFMTAFAAEDERVADGYAPFWRYRGLGLYGEQLRDLHRFFPPERVLLLRYRTLIDEPEQTLDAVARFLGISEGLLHVVPRSNARPYVGPGPDVSLWGRVIRVGAELGAYAPPEVWREASRPLLRLRRGRAKPARPGLSQVQRSRLLEHFEADIRLLESLTGLDLDLWRSTTDRGSYAVRSGRAAESPNGAPAPAAESLRSTP